MYEKSQIPANKVFEDQPKKMDWKVAPDGGGRRSLKNYFRPKTRRGYYKQVLKELVPWVLEDYDARNVYIGNYQALLTLIPFVLSPNQDGYELTPIVKQYKFNRCPNRTTAQRSHLYKEWSHKLQSLSKQNKAPKRVLSFGRMHMVLGEADTSRSLEFDEPDYEATFADDEDVILVENDSRQNKWSKRKLDQELIEDVMFDDMSDCQNKPRTLTKGGKRIQKMLAVDAGEGSFYESDEEDVTPCYESELDSNNDDMSLQAAINEIVAARTASRPRTVFSQNLGDGIVSIKASPEVLQEFPPGRWLSSGRKLPSTSGGTNTL